MSPLVIVLVLLAALWVISRVSDSFGEWVGDRVDPIVTRRVDARVARLRAAALAEGRPPGTPADPAARLRAGLVDLYVALAVGFVVAIGVGFTTTTSYYSDGTVESGSSVDFSFWLFVLFALVVYGAAGFRAATHDDGQTFGQRLFDYVPRRADGKELETGESMKRHMLRLAAAPPAVIAIAQGRGVQPLHDGWTSSLAVTLGEPEVRLL